MDDMQHHDNTLLLLRQEDNKGEQVFHIRPGFLKRLQIPESKNVIKLTKELK
jgi:hypothetical protein